MQLNDTSVTNILVQTGLKSAHSPSVSYTPKFFYVAT